MLWFSGPSGPWRRQLRVRAFVVTPPAAEAARREARIGRYRISCCRDDAAPGANKPATAGMAEASESWTASHPLCPINLTPAMGPLSIWGGGTRCCCAGFDDGPVHFQDPLAGRDANVQRWPLDRISTARASPAPSAEQAATPRNGSMSVRGGDDRWWAHRPGGEAGRHLSVYRRRVGVERTEVGLLPVGTGGRPFVGNSGASRLSGFTRRLGCGTDSIARRFPSHPCHLKRQRRFPSPQGRNHCLRLRS